MSGTKENPIEVEDSDAGLSYASAKEDITPTPVPLQVLPTLSSQRCICSKPFTSHVHYPSVSPADGVICTLLRVHRARVAFSK